MAHGGWARPMKLFNHFFSEVFPRPRYGVFLAGTLVGYFAATRLLQDFLGRSFRLAVPPSDIFASFGKIVQPEPLETPLYLLGYLLVPILATALYRFDRRYPQLFRRFLLIGIGVAVLVAGSLALEKFPFDRLQFYLQYVGRQAISHLLWLIVTKRIFVTSLVLSLSAIAGAWFLFYGQVLVRWFRVHQDTPILAKLEWLVPVAIAILVFHPNLPLDPHHYNFFLGPVNDVLRGKALLYETTHQYGFFDVYALAFVFRYLLPFTYPMAALVLTFLFFAFFVGLYVFLKRWLGSRLFALLSVSVLVAILYLFQTSPTRSALFFPAMTPLRYGLYLPALFLLQAFEARGRIFYREAALLFAAFSVLWAFDFGAYLAAATLIAIGYVEAVGAAKPVRALVALALRFGAYIAAVAALVSVATYGFFGVLPRWSLLLGEALEYGTGFGMFPLPAVGAFGVFVFGYLVTILVLIRQHRSGTPVSSVVLFLVVFGAFSLIYYVGRSMWQNLYLLIGPLWLLSLYAFHQIRNFHDTPWWHRAMGALWCALLVFGVLFLVVKLPVEFAGRRYATLGASLAGEYGGGLMVAAERADAVELVQRYPTLRRLAIISEFDTQVLVYAQRTNWFNFYTLSRLFSRAKMMEVVRRAQVNPPPYLFVGRRRNDQIEFFLAQVGSWYERIDTLRTLDVYRLKPKVGLGGGGR